VEENTNQGVNCEITSLAELAHTRHNNGVLFFWNTNNGGTSTRHYVFYRTPAKAEKCLFLSQNFY